MRISLESQPFRESGLFFSRSNRWIRPTRPNGRLLPGRRPRTPLPRLRHNIFDAGADASEAPVTVAHCLILTPKRVAGTAVGGCSFVIHVRHAAATIASGLCETVLITHDESGRSRRRARPQCRRTDEPRRQPPPFPPPQAARLSGESVTTGCSKICRRSVALTTRPFTPLPPLAGVYGPGR